MYQNLNSPRARFREYICIHMWDSRKTVGILPGPARTVVSVTPGSFIYNSQLVPVNRPTEVWRPRIPTDSVGRSGLGRRQPPRKAVTGPLRCHFLLIFQVLELIITKNRLPAALCLTLAERGDRGSLIERVPIPHSDDNVFKPPPQAARGKFCPRPGFGGVRRGRVGRGARSELGRSVARPPTDRPSF